MWIDAGLPLLTVAVNVSSRQFSKGDLLGTVVAALRDTGIDPQQLVIEVTESAMLLDEEEAIRILRALKDLGAQIALDDFGTGYSSLSHVRRLPLDMLKIDYSFVSELGRNTESASIVTAVIAMAHSMGLSVIAEGVERDDQADFLTAQGCDAAQGYLLSPPVEPEVIEALVLGELEKG